MKTDVMYHKKVNEHVLEFEFVELLNVTRAGCEMTEEDSCRATIWDAGWDRFRVGFSHCEHF